MKPADARTITEFLLASLDVEVGLTTRVFGAVPEGQLDYRPDAVSKTALGLLRHMTLEDEWMLNAVVDGAFGPLPDDSDACGIMTPADAIREYSARIPAAAARIKASPDDALAREVDMFGMIRMPAVGFLSLALRHTAHHRGQLSSYLRAMGGKVPAIYGPSADTVTAPA